MDSVTYQNFGLPAIGAAWLNEVNAYVYNYQDDQQAYVDVTEKRFGAVGDGTLLGGGTDDTVAILAAIAFAKSSGIKVIKFPGRPGQLGYRMTQGIVLDMPGMTILGDGGGGNSGGSGGSVGVIARGNFIGDNNSSASRLIFDFNGGDCIWVQRQGCKILGVAISRTDARYYTFPQNMVDNGIRVYAPDVVGPYLTARKFYFSDVRVMNQPGDGVVMSHDVVSSELHRVEVNYVKRHGFHVVGAAYFNRVNLTTRPGQIRFLNCVASRTGGLGIKIGELNPINNLQVPYRVEIQNMENFYNLVYPSLAIDIARPAANAIFGENMWCQVCAFDGRSEFVAAPGADGDPTHACLHVAGIHHNYFNQRAVQTTTPAIYVDAVIPNVTSGSRGIKFNNLYAVNNITGGAGYFNPAIQQQAACRGVQATSDGVISGIAVLLNKTLGTWFEEEFNGFKTFGQKVVFSDSVNCDANITANTVIGEQSFFGPIRHNLTSIVLEDDKAGYFQAIGIMYATLTVTGNIAGARSTVVALRCGDGSAFAEILSGTVDVSVGVGVLTTGSGDGVDTDLNVFVDTATNRVYIKNRRGATYAYGITFVGAVVGAASSGVYIGQFVPV